MPPPILSAAEYHRHTSYERTRMTPHHLDWANQPRLDKSYPPLDTLLLDRHPFSPAVDYMALVQQADGSKQHAPRPLDLQTIASLFRLTHAVTARSMHGDQPFYFRSVASAGALYPFELYLAVHHVDKMTPGVYHYDLFRFALNVLRSTPVPVLPPAAPGIAATVYVGGIFFRSAWKYRQRAYRYVLLDAGHLIENLRLALSALGLAFSMELDFDDAAAGALLGLAPTREACLACVHIMDERNEPEEIDPAGDLKPLSSEIGRASRVSKNEKSYEWIKGVHRAGYAKIDATGDHPGDSIKLGELAETWHPLAPAPALPGPKYTDVLGQRRSRRNFVPAPLDARQWAGMMDLISSAARTPVSRRVLPAIGILAGRGVPISPGFYILDAPGRRLGRLVSGDLIEPMAAACLDQMWLKNAAFHLVFITDPAALDRRWGARAYRHVMIEAGRLGQQAYLAAAALGLGGCGIGAVYDREAADILNLPDDGAMIYLVGIGPVKTR